METLKNAGHAPVNGLQMYYEIHGEGDMPLVLIHGGGSTLDSTFGTLLPLFAANGKVIALELQAHGRTSDRDAPESFEQDADDVAALLKYLGVAKANILGFSNGGTTALQIAIRHPQLVNKIVPVSANCKRDGLIAGFFEGMQHATLDHMPGELKDAYLKVTPSAAGLQNMFNKDKERMLNFKDMNDADLQDIKAPVLFMVADQDVITVEHTVAMMRLVSNARLAILPGAHGSFIASAEGGAPKGSKLPQLVVALIEEFLEA